MPTLPDPGSFIFEKMMTFNLEVAWAPLSIVVALVVAVDIVVIAVVELVVSDTRRT